MDWGEEMPIVDCGKGLAFTTSTPSVLTTATKIVARHITVAKSFFGICHSCYIMGVGLLKWFFVKLSCLRFVKV
jgi:hypothetical protein